MFRFELLPLGRLPQQLSSPLDSDEVDIWTNLDSRLFELLLKNNRTCFWTTQDCHGKRMRSGCSKGNKDLRDIFTQKKREKMIKIRHVEKNYSTHSVLTLMDIDTRGNWLHFLFNPISPINNGRDRCWAIFCSFFWVNHPLMDPFWLCMNSSNANVIFYLASSTAIDCRPHARILQTHSIWISISNRYEHRWESLFNQAKNKTSIYLFTILIIQPVFHSQVKRFEFFLHYLLPQNQSWYF